MRRLENRIALITGAGGGFGRAIAQEFAHEGAHVFATDVSEDGTNETAELIRGEGGSATAIRLDVRRTDDIASVLKTIEEKHGKLHVLVNNAGITQREDFRHISDEQWNEILDINLTAAMRLSRDALKLLAAAEGASIINVSSIMEGVHVRQLSAYSTTKAAIAGLSRSVAVEYAAFGVRVNYICPGYAATGMTERILRNEAVRKGLIDRTPLKRFAETQDIAKAALFLASDDASFITGEGLTVDGGMNIQL
ncbi:MAG: SDR family oxidoreductase [Hyphomicrobiaceae bacterium]|nr:SDR family oxidoreductase [Hyphomicrobiaceae bacterium]